MAARRKKSGPKEPETPQPTKDNRLSVLVEMLSHPGSSGMHVMSSAHGMDVPGFEVDEQFEPVTLGTNPSFGAVSRGTSQSESTVLRGTVNSEEEMHALRERPEVAGVWRDTPISPFPGFGDPQPTLQGNGSAMNSCPIPPCDCEPATPKGDLADVAQYLGVDQIWNSGFRGAGIVVGVLDSGITAQGRPVKPGETHRRIPRVINGWPSDWGTESGKWGEHGNMCATDVLGMAPEAQLYDLRIAGSGGSPGTISRALQAFNWALSQFRTDGTPQILTNSWGIFQEAWDNTYARNPNHPFTRKVVEAINEGMIVLFAAGNCGDTCPDNRCGSDTGPGNSIWGANGHPMVMTIGAVNKDEDFIGYSSQGPAALDSNKPDFCSISHFRGYFNSDSGTSAATPILAGAVALLKQASPGSDQNDIKEVLKATAKDIGPSGFDQHSGAGIVQIKAAYDHMHRPVIRPTLTASCKIRPTLIASHCGIIRSTQIGCPPRRTILGSTCPRPTFIGPRCPRPTFIGARCPRPTFIPELCPRPTRVGCPRPTIFDCPRPTLVSCTRPTSMGCSRPSLLCGFSGDDLSGYEEQDLLARLAYTGYDEYYANGWGADMDAEDHYVDDYETYPEADYWYDADQ